MVWLIQLIQLGHNLNIISIYNIHKYLLKRFVLYVQLVIMSSYSQSVCRYQRFLTDKCGHALTNSWPGVVISWPRERGSVEQLVIEGWNYWRLSSSTITSLPHSAWECRNSPTIWLCQDSYWPTVMPVRRYLVTHYSNLVAFFCNE